MVVVVGRVDVEVGSASVDVSVGIVIGICAGVCAGDGGSVVVVGFVVCVGVNCC